MVIKKIIHIMKRILFVTLLTTFCFSVNAQNCKSIQKKVKDLKGEVVFSSPYKSNSITLYKTITDQDTTYELVAMCTSTSLTINAPGLYIKLSDGTIIKDETLQSKAHVAGVGYYYYLSDLVLSEDQIELLKKNKIVKYGIYNFENTVSSSYAGKLQEYMSCLCDSK
jgi:hypothetical protein